MTLNQLQLNVYAIILLTAMFLMMACEDKSDRYGKDAIRTNQDMLLHSQTDQKQRTNKVPLNKQELEAFFPLRIGKYERDFQHVSEDMATTEGAFGQGKIYMKIVDSHGPIGSSIITTFNALYDLKEEMQPATIIEKKSQNGIKTVNRYETDTGNSSIELIYLNRFHVLLQGKNLTPEELWHLFRYDHYVESLKQFSKVND
jgi:hypothetical protein